MIDRETGLWIYNKMNEIRDFEETAWTLFTENKLRGSVHLYTGEEAVAASVCAQLTDEDYIASTHRGHGHCIAKGAELDRALAELMGKATGYCKGRSGSMHIADFSKGNLGANAIVGGGIPIATGGGLAIKMQNRKNVSVAFFGDGASNQGTFHESINLAAVWKLPVIYVCENNQFGMTVPTWQSTSVENIADRAAGYGIPGEVVDGNDVCAVYEAFARAKERALKGEGPTLLECKTYRWAWPLDRRPGALPHSGGGRGMEGEAGPHQAVPRLSHPAQAGHPAGAGRHRGCRRQEDGGRCGVRHEQPGARSGPCSGRRVL